jgi:hypothetical protein
MNWIDSELFNPRSYAWRQKCATLEPRRNTALLG